MLQHSNLRQAIQAAGSGYMEDLSEEQRRESLIAGFVRDISPSIMLPADVSTLVTQYIGNMEPDQLLTLKESGLECCGPRTLEGKYTVKVFFYIIILIKLSIDITALSVAAISYNNDANIASKSIFRSFDVSDWLLVGSICDIVITIIYVLAVHLMTDLENPLIVEDYENWSQELKDSTCCLVPVLTPFYVLWISFGYVLWLQMESGSATSNVVLSWCIMQSAIGLISLLHSQPYKWMFSKDQYVENWDQSLCVVEGGTCPIWCFVVIILSKEFAAILIGLGSDCDTALSGNSGSPLGAMSVNTWMLVGGVVNLYTMSIVLCFQSQHFMDAFLPLTEMLSRTLIILTLLFRVLWSTLGFILYAHMDGEYECSKMTLA